MTDQMVTFYDPHPALAGCPEPLPTEVKKVADDLDGCTLTLDEAFNRIRSAALSYTCIKVHSEDDGSGFIYLLAAGEYPDSTNGWRVIRFIPWD